MKQLTLRNSVFAFSLLALSACGQPSAQLEESCSKTGCTEKDINAPVNPEVALPTVPSAPAVVPAPPSARSGYRFPIYQDDWQVSLLTYQKMEEYYNLHIDEVKNTRYVTIIDFTLHSSFKRLLMIDLKTGEVEFHNTAHGKNSDPDGDGYATKFSNTNNSLQSSLGFYLTLGTYNGSHGYSMKLRGLEETNNNAEARDIVMHPADYVSDSSNYAGRSWGCPAIDPKISKKLIDRIKDGSLLLIDYNPEETRRR